MDSNVFFLILAGLKVSPASSYAFGLYGCVIAVWVLVAALMFQSDLLDVVMDPRD